MTIKSLALAGLFSLVATAALADTVSATLVKPVSSTTKFISDDTQWTCSGSTCSTTNPSGDAVTASGCRGVTKEVGAVSSYGDLDKAALAKCNAGRPGATDTASAH